jgi:DNA polymerase III epsilon subunit family exonuclease
MKNFFDQECVIVDVETTGLSYRGGDRVIEIAAIKTKNFEVMDTWQTLLDPGREVSYGAFLVNGISTEMLEGQPKAEQMLPQFKDFIGAGCLVGHNLRFDINFLNHELSLSGLPLLPDDHTLDTCRMARGLLPHLQRYSLERVAYYLGYRKRQQHRAMSDVQMTLAALKAMVPLARKNNVHEMGQLIDLFGLKKQRKMPVRTKWKMISDGLREKIPLTLLYTSVSSGMTCRKVRPRQLLGEGRHAVLVAYCCLRQEERFFNLDKIIHVQAGEKHHHASDPL